MADIATRKPVRTADARTWAIILGLLVATAVIVRESDPERFAWVQSFFVIFGSLLIQALPFVLIGAFAAAVIEVFVPRSALERLTKLPRALQLPAAGLAGIAFPICECGSVPVARRLIPKGLDAGRRHHVHARGAGREPGGDRVDVLRVPRTLVAVDDGHRAVHARTRSLR